MEPAPRDCITPMLPMPRLREQRVVHGSEYTRAWGLPSFTNICIKNEITSLNFVTSANRCKGHELRAASRPIAPIARAARWVLVPGSFQRSKLSWELQLQLCCCCGPILTG